MKNFMYFENAEGGMVVYVLSRSESLKGLHGWMNDRCKEWDSLLVDWMESADVGDHFEHRLGVMVRVKDAQAAEGEQR